MIINPKYNGNIAEIDWMSKDGSLKRYGYQYDNLNRLLRGNYQDPGRAIPESHLNDEILTYDVNGNIKTLFRQTVNDRTYTAVVIDNLSYQYAGNRVTNITDASGNGSGYEGGGQTITYDLNGNTTKMPDKGILAITYNFLNLPTEINQNANTLKYFYRADGAKLKKQFTLVNSSGTKLINTEYLDGFQYSTPNTEPIRKALEKEDDATMKVTTAGEEEAFSKDPDRKIVVVDPGTPQNETMTLSFFPTAEGFYDFENLRYIYQYKDHLGNVRVSYTKNGNDLEIRDRNDYYPFGMSFLKPSGTTSMYDPMAIPYNYKYNGKELQETGMYDYGARFYMPDIGRWGVVDPLAEQYRRHSTYNYTVNNPIRFIDPDGRGTEDWVKRGNQVFFDSEIKTQEQATAKYGENASHFAEGSTITTSQGEENISQYTFHDDGTITNADGSQKSSKETFETKGGTTIIGTESKGNSISLSVNGVLGGGFGFDLGLVKDSGNNFGLFLNANINFGLGFEGGIGVGKISPSHSGPFLLEDYSGEAKSFISPVGVTYGGTFDPKSTPLEMMNPLNVGAGKRGLTEVSSGLKGIGTGVFYKRSKTRVWDF